MNAPNPCSALIFLALSLISHAEAQKFQPSEVKVKGLYIGMDISTFPVWFKEHLKDTSMGYTIFPDLDQNKQTHIVIVDFSPLAPRNKEDGKDFELALAAFELYRGGPKPCIITANEAGQVIEIKFQPYLVDTLFQSSAMDASDFVQAFVNAYKTSPMKVDDSLESWSYTSSDGTKVTIGDKKSLLIEKVPDKVQREANFD